MVFDDLVLRLLVAVRALTPDRARELTAASERERVPLGLLLGESGCVVPAALAGARELIRAAGERVRRGTIPDDPWLRSLALGDEERAEAERIVRTAAAWAAEGESQATLVRSPAAAPAGPGPVPPAAGVASPVATGATGPAPGSADRTILGAAPAAAPVPPSAASEATRRVTVPPAASRIVPPPPAPAAAIFPEDTAGTPFGRYRLLAELGRGGMGVVWKAWDIQLKRIVALKQILGAAAGDSAQLERFLREAQLAAKLKHPNIVGVLDVGAHAGQHYFTCDYIAGRPLGALMKEPIPPKQSVAWVRAVADALAYSHELGVVHRDVKPGNILIDERGTPFVMDFGLAKEVETTLASGARRPGSSTSAGPALTVSGALLGTPMYMSPEQASGHPERVGPASDQFSLGVVLYELLAGRLPFEGQGLRELLNAITEKDPVPPSHLNRRIHPDLETICLRALEKAPESRYPTAAEMAADLGRYVDGEPIQARRHSSFTRALRKARKHRHVVVPVAAAVAIALGLAAWLVAASVGKARRCRELLAQAADRERAGQLAEAVTAYEAAIELDGANAEAVAARDRVKRRFAAVRAEEQGRAARADEILKKSQLVSKVLRRWGRLAATLRDLEGLASDAAAPAGERQARAQPLWTEVQEFVRDTPPDSASQATARALEGWAVVVAGDEAKGLAQLRAASALDPDIPYGPLLEIMAALMDWAVTDVRFDISFDLEQMNFNLVPPEPARRAEFARRVEANLARARGAGVWGKESAEDFRALVEGATLLEKQDFARAEAALTQALEAPDLKPLESGLFLVRACARVLSDKPDGARKDMAEAVRARPGDPHRQVLLAVIDAACALEALGKNGEPLPFLDEAIGALGKAIAGGAPGGECHAHRAGLHGWYAMIAGARGGDARPWYDRSIADLEDAIRLEPDRLARYPLCARLCARRGEARARHGEDPRADFDRACAVCDAALGHDPRCVGALTARAEALRMGGDARAARGDDPRPDYRRAVADCRSALAVDPGARDAHEGLPTALRCLAAAGAAHGEEPEAGYAAALAAADDAAQRFPDRPKVPLERGEIWLRRGELEAERGQDPGGSYRRAIGEFDRVLKLDATFYEARVGRASARLGIGQWATAHGGDPRAGYNEALADCAEAQRLVPHYAETYKVRSRLYESGAVFQAAHGVDSRKVFELAVADDDEALKLDPEDAATYGGRGRVLVLFAQHLAALKQDPRPVFERAVADYEQALKRRPEWWHLRANQAQLYEALGRLDAAVAAYEAALRANPGDARLQQFLERARVKAAAAAQDGGK